MKEHVKAMFEQITMPAETEQKIRLAMAGERKPRKRYPNVLRAGTTMAAMLALIFALSPTARAAVNDVVRYVFGGYSAIVFDAETGAIQSSISYPAPEDSAVDPEETGYFVETTGGRMYFCADGEYIDITDRTSMEMPYIYTYIDDEKIEHMLIIGGVPGNFGVSEFYREVKEGQQDWQGWIGGYSSNYLDNTTGKAYPWVAAAWEELNLPWPVPGA